ncbi:MAG: hypothetical protein WC565_06960 [Parcubacteria group bacterium]
MSKRYIVEEVEESSGMGCLSIIGLLVVLLFLGTCLAAMGK